MRLNVRIVNFLILAIIFSPNSLTSQIVEDCRESEILTKESAIDKVHYHLLKKSIKISSVDRNYKPLQNELFLQRDIDSLTKKYPNHSIITIGVQLNTDKYGCYRGNSGVFPIKVASKNGRLQLSNSDVYARPCPPLCQNGKGIISNKQGVYSSNIDNDILDFKNSLFNSERLIKHVNKDLVKEYKFQSYYKKLKNNYDNRRGWHGNSVEFNYLFNNIFPYRSDSSISINNYLYDHKSQVDSVKTATVIVSDQNSYISLVDVFEVLDNNSTQIDTIYSHSFSKDSFKIYINEKSSDLLIFLGHGYNNTNEVLISFSDGKLKYDPEMFSELIPLENFKSIIMTNCYNKRFSKELDSIYHQTSYLSFLEGANSYDATIMISTYIFALNMYDRDASGNIVHIINSLKNYYDIKSSTDYYLRHNYFYFQ